MDSISKKLKCELYNDSMQNFKRYGIPKAQLIIADAPYCVGQNFFASNPMWYEGGDNKNGESKFAGKAAFPSDFNFNLYEFSTLLKQNVEERAKAKPNQRPFFRRSINDSVLFC